MHGAHAQRTFLSDSGLCRAMPNRTRRAPPAYTVEGSTSAWPPLWQSSESYLARSCHGNVSPDPRQNHLLAALPDAEWAALAAQLEPVDMPLGEVLYESGVAMATCTFRPPPSCRCCT